MSRAFAEDAPCAPGDPSGPPEQLIVSFASWEGPLDLLLSLARQQKIDLARVPLVPLVDQYLQFIQAARALRLEIAADYLVMAAWLAYLKSALLLPRDPAAEPDPDQLADRLRWRLRRLEAMRGAADRLLQRDLVGRDVFLRGRPEGLRTVRHSRVDVSLYNLLAACGAVHGRARPTPWTPHGQGLVCTLEAALARLSALVGQALDWTDLKHFLPDTPHAGLARSTLASSFVAALELARTGAAELSQAAPFAPLMLRGKARHQ